MLAQRFFFIWVSRRPIRLPWQTGKAEQIQPVFGTVQVSSSCDTAVVFTDTETGETYEIGYLTPGIREKIRLRRGRWYTVTGAGELTMGAVILRIE